MALCLEIKNIFFSNNKPSNKNIIFSKSNILKRTLSDSSEKGGYFLLVGKIN